MSQSKRDRMQGNIFGGQKPVSAATTLEELTRRGYGDISGMIEDAALVAEPVRIVDIHPDRLQPRRVIPSPVRDKWSGRTDPATMSDMLARWWGMVDAERAAAGRLPFNLAGYLNHEIDPDEDAPEPGPIEASWLALVSLAASIHRDGLTNAITVVQTAPTQYVIETGERRWLAYHLLLWSYQAEEVKWSKIPSRIVAEVNVWRQAAENGARENLNAISKARQYALLLMRACEEKGKEEDRPVQFRSIEDFTHERQFYAQALECRIPHGQRERIMQAMGISASSEISRIRDLLMLHDAVWEFADDFNIPRLPLFEVLDLSEDQALYKLKKMFPMGAFFESSPNGTPPSEKPPKRAPQAESDTKHLFGQVWKAWKGGKSIKRSELEQVKAWIAEVERTGTLED